ncbi:MAG TPA: phosphate ABC transporter permease PtsA, partial [Rhodopila sp.]|nr:phosphate ABC transporter permease PtsA [Rhodopila sp.]
MSASTSRANSITGGAIPGPAKDMKVARALGLRRKRINTLIKVACLAATILGLVLLASILFTLLWRGLNGLSLTVFTNITKSPGSHGGLLNAIVGSLIQTA